MTDLKQKALSLPLKPGVYIMMDKSGQVIYVGKAKQLKNRVSQYFHESGDKSPKTQAMVSQIHSFDTIIAASEFEALVLECSLIKYHKPKYNIMLKDDKGYPFIRVSLRDDYPRFTIESKMREDGVKYFGPFGGRFILNDVINAIISAFRLPICSKQFPQEIGRGRACLKYHMGQCIAVCQGNVSSAEYHEIIDQAVKLLDGKFDDVLQEITADMESASEALNFEKAAVLRDRLKAIKRLDQKQSVILNRTADTDAVGIHIGDAHTVVAVLHYIEGKLLGRHIEVLPAYSPGEESELISAFLKQFYISKPLLPRYILLQTEIEDAEPMLQILNENSKRKTEIIVPKRGERASMVSLAITNAGEENERITTGDERRRKSITDLQKALGLEAPPERIESFDISNISGTDIVGSMVVFQNGQPRKSAYRKFKIKTIDSQDDYHSMREVISRRLARYLEGDEKFFPLPDLMLIDGGKAHASCALDVVQAAGLSLPVFGMVKDDRHRTRALITPEGLEIAISATPALFAFIGRIQEETHRFAIEFHRQQRSKRSVASVLDDIDSVGDARRNALIKKFRSIKAIKGATVEELSQAVPKNVAQAVFDYFRKS